MSIDDLPNGQIFQIADGSMSLYEFGEMVSRCWDEAYPSVPMYQVGAPSDDTDYPNITWRSFNKQPTKMRTIEEFSSDDGKMHTKKIREFRCVFEVRVAAESPKQSNQIVMAFERFMEQYTGAFKKEGIKEVIYLERLADAFEKRSGNNISYRYIQYEVHEQIATIEADPVIDVAEIHLRVTDEDYATETVTRIE
jgi:hypothetical protein